MDRAAFAARRADQFAIADSDLAPVVAKAIQDSDWSPVVDFATETWRSIFADDAPGAYEPRVLREFQDMLLEHLEKTTGTDVGRVVRWVNTFTVGNATWNANRANGYPQARWVTMKDSSVRDTHRRAQGQTIRSGGTFDIGGYQLHYPGEPVGPPSVWIECRCVMQPVGKGRVAMANGTAFDADIEVDTEVDKNEPEIKITHAGLAVRASDTGRVLMLQRGLSDQEDPARGKWEFPGGSIEDGEAPLDAAGREWAEEVGMPVPEGHITGEWVANGMYAGFVLDVPDESSVTPHDGRDLVVNPDDPEGDEVEAIAWWTPTDMRDNPVVREELAATLDDVLTALDAACPCCGGSGEHDTGAECYGCDASGKAMYFTGPLPCEGAKPETAAERFGRIVMERYDALRGGNMTTSTATDEEQVVDEPIEAEQEVEEPGTDAEDVDVEQDIPVHGIAAPVNVVSGDGRRFTDQIQFRQFPLPLWVQEGSKHGMAPTPLLCGRLDRVWVEDGVVKFEGALKAGTEAAAYVIEGLAFGNLRSVSVDLGDLTVALEQSADDWNGMPITDLQMAEIAGLTIVGIGAFKEAYIGLGTWEDELACAECAAEDPIDAETAPLMAAMLAAGALPEEIGLTDDEAIAFLQAIADMGAVDLTELTEAELAEYEALPYDQSDAWLLEHHPEAFFAVGAVSHLEHASLTAAGVAFAPGTHDGPGWITDPVATERIRRYWVRGEGAAKIRWGVPGDFNRCRKQLVKYVQNPDWLAGLCANMHKEALGVWPGMEDGRAAAAISLVASGAITTEVVPASVFKMPEPDYLVPITIMEDGRVFGHLAAWGECHIGIPGVCTTAPQSASGYGFFHTGRVETTEGWFAVGHLTKGIGHAPEGRVSAAQATAHYDRDDAIFADVVMTDGALGIWFCGIMRDNDPALRREIMATGAISGDWRKRRGYGLEMVGAVLCGVPGFPLPPASFSAHDGEQLSLIASGTIVSHEIAPGDLEEFDGMVNAVADELEHRAALRAQRAAKLAAARAHPVIRAARIAAAKSLVPEGV